MQIRQGFIIGIISICLLACNDRRKIVDVSGNTSPETVVNAKFTLMPPEETGVNFTNRFTEDYNYNILLYEYMYNGGGVAAGDVNGDSLPDLYFSATFGPNILYINQGNFKFMNVTVSAGVAAPVGFKTGVAMADINGDGRLDIYSCRTSKTDNGQKNDHVFINMGNKIENGVAIPIFEDQGEKLGLLDNSSTSHVCFVDYDRDGDMDIFLVNHKTGDEEATKLRLQQREDGSVFRMTKPLTPFESNKLYRNDNGKFTDVTVEAGVVSSAFGLSATASDINRDGWMDIYVANDYIEPDFILINNKDGTFTDKYFEYLRHSSQNSMGADIADINNDGLDDIIVLDMMPDDPLRYKLLSNVQRYDRYNMLVQYGYGRQIGRNVLQLNNGNNTYSEIGEFAGIATTDWSWGALVTDFDNDGWKDTYISNGYRRDVTNYDYLNFVLDSINKLGGLTPQRYPDINEVLNIIPEKKLTKFLFLNNKELGFTNATKQAGMDQVAFSSGAAFADLDRDGDLDIIVNNLMDPAFIYRNDLTANNWLQIDVEYDSKNKDGIGSMVDLYTGANHQHQVLMINKGFYSTSEPILHFGVGEHAVIDSIIFQWPDGTVEIMKSVKPNQRLYWKRGSGTPYKRFPKTVPPALFASLDTLAGWTHKENEFVDFKREKLIPYQLSAEGPCISVGDINGDNLDDIYAGNGSGFAGGIFVQTGSKQFTPLDNTVFKNDIAFEDCGSVIEDMDGDGDNDLVVISGGNAFQLNDAQYMSRYYINDGKGQFKRSMDFPIITTNAGAILSFDYDQDNDMDLIIAGRATPGKFPDSPKSHLLRNDGGKFKDVTNEVFPELSQIGMIADIKEGDLDGDKKTEVVLVGEWLPVTVFSFDGSAFKNKTSNFGLDQTSGWWKAIEITDIDGDGDNDLIGGNMGLNHRMHASPTYPITLVYDDFDGNGSIDPVLCFYHNGKLYPYAGKDALIGQIPVLKKKFVRYTPYAYATIEDIFTEDQLAKSSRLTTNTFENTLFINDNNTFTPGKLPYQAQFAPVFDIVIEDFNGDGRKDILMAGNYLYSETETAEIDAGNGTLLLQQADGTFVFEPNRHHGFWAQKEVRELEILKLGDGSKAILTGNNKGPLELHIMTNTETKIQ